MTLLISTQDVEKSFGIEPLFTHISLGIFAQERLGLIGPNGSGKSTLLKILMGLEKPDAGKVIRNGNVNVVYLAQADQFLAEQTIKSILFGEESDILDDNACLYRISQVAGDLLFPKLNQPIGSLSGGWRKRVGIVQALLKNPDVLLMDEPTNHLDLEGILWLENILKNIRFALVLVTHDRYFLENIANVMVELGKIYPEGYFKASGNYSHFLDQRTAFISGQLKKEQSLANKLRREEEWLRRMPKARTTKAQYRIDQAVQLKSDLQQVHTANMTQHRNVDIAFSATQRKTKNLLEMHHVSLSRGSKSLFTNLSLNLSPGKCLGLLGKNGSGKTSLMQLLAGSLTPDTGSIERAENLRIVFFDQKREQLNQNQTLLQALAPSGDGVLYQGQNLHVAAFAKRFLFSKEQLSQSVSHFSGGEQARILIANLMVQPADILLLDEPTNDLDIPTLEVLEDSLREFKGAVVLITHDRYLLDRLSDQILFLDGQGKAEFFADYAQWYTVTQTESTNTKPAVTLNTSPITTQKTSGLSYEERRELSRLPEKIQKIENQIAALEKQLHDPAKQSDTEGLLLLCKQIDEEKSKAALLYSRWEELEWK